MIKSLGFPLSALAVMWEICSDASTRPVKARVILIVPQVFTDKKRVTSMEMYYQKVGNDPSKCTLVTSVLHGAIGRTLLKIRYQAINADPVDESLRLRSSDNLHALLCYCGID